MKTATPAIRPAAPAARTKAAPCGCVPDEVRDAGLPLFMRGAPVAAAGRLVVGRADDPAEHEAEAFAHATERGTAVSVRPAARAPAKLQRLCAACAEEAQELIPVQRAPEAGARSDPAAAAPRTTGEAGQALAPAVRAPIEHTAGQDLGHVRVHAGPDANMMARRLGARAFTHGDHIWLGARERADDLHLMAHEVAHVIQQGAAAPGTAPIRRTADPTNTSLWSWFEPEHRRSDFRGVFDETLGAAPERAMQMEEALARGEGVPSDEASRAALDSAFTRRMETLVRLNALGLMASHRASIEMRRDQLLRPQAVPEVMREGPGDRASAMAGLRQAATALQQLNATKDSLQGSRNSLRGVSIGSLHGDLCLSLNSCVEDWLQTIYDQTRYRETLASARMNAARAQVLSDGRLPSSLLRVFFRFWADELVDWRDRQIAGVNASIGQLYEQFPLFKTLPAGDITGEPELAGDDALARRAAQAYEELLVDVDDAIVEIGSGDIHAFDLPEAVRLTETNLPAAARTEFQRVRRDHEITQFWLTMGLTIAQVAAVFIPVVGPFIAAGIGVVTTGIDLERLMDRVQLAQASTRPDDEMLGATAPGAFDYAMAGIQVLLTAADIGMLAAELRGGARGAAELSGHGPEGEVPGGGARGHGEAEPGGPHGGPGERRPVAGEGGEVPGGTSASRRSAAERAHVLEDSGAVQDGTRLSPDQRAVEIDAVQRGEARASTRPGYVDEVALENGHVWRRKADGTWCRFSGPPSLCGSVIPGVPSAAAVHPALPHFNRLQSARLRRLGEQLNDHGLSWNSIGLGDEAGVTAFFAGRSDISSGIAELEARAARQIDLAGSHAETGLAPRRGAGAEAGDNPGMGLRTEGDMPVPEGRRLPREQGAWDGEPGNSPWLSDNLDVYRITNGEPIPFVNGEPQLVHWAEEGVILRDMTGIDHVDFASADRGLMRQYPGRWATQGEVAEWRSTQRLTWHHEPDLETMTLVPMDLHGNIPHLGGASLARAGGRPASAAPFGTHPL